MYLDFNVPRPKWFFYYSFFIEYVQMWRKMSVYRENWKLKTEDWNGLYVILKGKKEMLSFTCINFLHIQPYTTKG